MLRTFFDLGASVGVRFLGFGASLGTFVDVRFLGLKVSLGEDGAANIILSCYLDRAVFRNLGEPIILALSNFQSLSFIN